MENRQLQERWRELEQEYIRVSTAYGALALVAAEHPRNNGGLLGFDAVKTQAPFTSFMQLAPAVSVNYSPPPTASTTTNTGSLLSEDGTESFVSAPSPVVPFHQTSPSLSSSAAITSLVSGSLSRPLGTTEVTVPLLGTIEVNVPRTESPVAAPIRARPEPVHSQTLSREKAVAPHLLSGEEQHGDRETIQVLQAECDRLTHALANETRLTTKLSQETETIPEYVVL